MNQLTEEHGPRLFSKAQCADRLGISVRTLQDVITSGKLRPTVIGRRVLVSAEEMRLFIERATRDAAKRP